MHATQAKDAHMTHTQSFDRSCHPDTDRMVAEFEAKRAAPKAAPAEEQTRARCHECQRSFPLPAVGRCPFDDCRSTQIGPISPLEQPMRDLLAEIDTLRAEHKLAEERIER